MYTPFLNIQRVRQSDVRRVRVTMGCSMQLLTLQYFSARNQFVGIRQIGTIRRCCKSTVIVLRARFNAKHYDGVQKSIVEVYRFTGNAFLETDYLTS